MIAISIKNPEVAKHIKTLEKKDLKQLLLKIHELGQITWQESNLKAKHGMGHEKIIASRLNADAIRNRLPDGIEHFIVFRYFGKKALMGYKCPKEIFNIVHVDDNFTAYNH